LLREVDRRIKLLGRAAARFTNSRSQAQVDTIRLRLLKIGALVKVSARRVLLRFSSAYPWKAIFQHDRQALRC
jgi:hypothetical protein